MRRKGIGQIMGVIAVAIGAGLIWAFVNLDTNAIFKIVPILGGIGFIIVGVGAIRGDD